MECRKEVAVALILTFATLTNGIPDFVKNLPDLVVTTKTSGIIYGKTVTLKDGLTKIQEFHNIRYAEAPVGQLRFRPPKRTMATPQATLPWLPKSKHVQEPNDKVIKCVHALGTYKQGQEDCLFLTVRTPDVLASRPVIVWIHGGGLVYRWGMEPGYSFDSEVTNKLDAVTVNINYRLGFLGFSSVEELWDEKEGVYANNGIRDMIAALDWIQDNIRAFGGDPNSVTVMGQSGGASAVLALICSPLANNKFHAAIAKSPAPEMRFNHEDGNKYQRTIVDQVGCGTQETLADRKNCLLKVPAHDFTSAKLKMWAGAAYFNFPMIYGEAAEVVGLIMIDPTVVTVTPRHLEEAPFAPDSPLPIIISNVAEENYSDKWAEKPPFSSEKEAYGTMEHLLTKLTGKTGWLDVIQGLYPGKDALTIWSLLQCDMRSTCPTNDVAEAMSRSKNRDIYRLYVTRTILNLPPDHTNDAYTLFDFTYPRLTMQPTEKDRKLHMQYIEMVKKLATDKRVDSEWETFPRKSMIYEDTDEISKVVELKPQQSVCKKLTELDLVKYGWQNK